MSIDAGNPTTSPGDQLNLRATVIEARLSTARKGLGILRWRWQLFKAGGTEVLDLEATSLFDLARASDQKA